MTISTILNPLLKEASQVPLWYRGTSYSNPLDLRDDGLGNEYDRFGPGIYLTNRYETAAEYGKVYAFEINVSKGFYTEDSPIDSSKLEELISYAPTEYSGLKNNKFIQALLREKNMVMALSVVSHRIFWGDRTEYLMCARAAEITGLIVKPREFSEEKHLILYNPKIAYEREVEIPYEDENDY
jgi:hypothetical protein